MLNKTTNIAIFLGTDIVSHIILNKLLKMTEQTNFRFVIFNVDQQMNPKLSKELKQLFFLERIFLKKYIYPYLASLRDKKDFFLPPLELMSRYPHILKIKNTKNINSKSILEDLKNSNIIGGISIRCYQKFSSSLISYFKEHSYLKNQYYFVNLHPGILPKYRGVTTYCRSMQNGEEKAGFSLHFIDENWDSGPVIKIKTKNINYQKSVITNMYYHSDIATKMLFFSLQKLGKGIFQKSIVQNLQDAKYYSHPSSEDFQDFKFKKIRLIDYNELVDFVLRDLCKLKTKQINNFKNLTKQYE